MTESELLQNIYQEVKSLKKDNNEIISRLGGIETCLGNMENRMSNMENRMSCVEDQIRNLERRMDNVEKQNKKLNQQIEDIKRQMKRTEKVLRNEIRKSEYLVLDEVERVHAILDAHKADRTVHTM